MKTQVVSGGVGKGGECVYGQRKKFPGRSCSETGPVRMQWKGSVKKCNIVTNLGKKVTISITKMCWDGSGKGKWKSRKYSIACGLSLYEMESHPQHDQAPTLFPGRWGSKKKDYVSNRAVPPNTVRCK